MTTNKQVTVTTTSQAIVTVDDVTQHVYIHAAHKTFLGDEGVTSSNGYQMDIDDKLTIVLSPGEVLYGVAQSGSGTIYVLITAQK